MPGEHLEQFALAVAGDAGDADDLARAQREVDRRRARVTPRRVAQRDRFGVEQRRRPASAGALSSSQPHLAADHQLGQLLARRLGGRTRRHHLAVAHDVDRVGDRHDLAQLVRDQDDGHAARAQGAQDAEQLIGLLRRQHRGRLVEDQDARAAIQRLQDLDALLLADRQVADQRVGIDAAARSRAPSRSSSARACREAVRAAAAPASAPSTTFSSTVNVSTSMKC